MGAYLGSYAVDLYSMGVDTSPALSSPALTAEQKAQMKTLMDQYFNNDSKFIYDGTARRQCYAYTTSGDISTTSLVNCRNSDDKYYLNCGLFAQMIWMGRAIEDFNTATPVTTITKAFDWGYYFDFLLAQNAFGVKKADGSYYSGNTYTTDSGTYFITFDNASSMANELYYKGYEIPYSQCDIGDLVFYRSSDISDGTTDELEQTSFRYITHVAVCYDVVDNTPVFLECTSAGTYSGSRCTGRYGITKTPYHNASGASRTLGNLNLTRGAKLCNKVVMCARHPAAFGAPCNVPTQFAAYK